MRLADAPIDLERPILLYRRDWFEGVHPDPNKMLHARDQVVEVYTPDGYCGARAGAKVDGGVKQYQQWDRVPM